MSDFEPSDAVLIARSLADPDAFRLVFRRHYPSVARFLQRRLGASRGEELAAETFARAFARRDRYVPGAPTARPWLFGIASNLASAARRAEERQLRAYGRLPLGRVEDEAASADARLDARSEIAPLVDSLLALSREDREALLLYAWADLTYAEIAEALGIPVGTVRSRINRARLKTRNGPGPDPAPPLTEGVRS